MHNKWNQGIKSKKVRNNQNLWVFSVCILFCNFIMKFHFFRPRCCILQILYLKNKKLDIPCKLLKGLCKYNMSAPTRINFNHNISNNDTSSPNIYYWASWNRIWCSWGFYLSGSDTISFYFVELFVVVPNYFFSASGCLQSAAPRPTRS